MTDETLVEKALEAYERAYERASGTTWEGATIQGFRREGIRAALASLEERERERDALLSSIRTWIRSEARDLPDCDLVLADIDTALSAGVRQK